MLAILAFNKSPILSTYKRQSFCLSSRELKNVYEGLSKHMKITAKTLTTHSISEKYVFDVSEDDSDGFLVQYGQ